MPFDCVPISDLSTIDCKMTEIGVKPGTPKPLRLRRIPPSHITRLPGRAEAAMAVLVRARGFLADERRWCKGAFARSFFEIPVPVHSGLARRFCALGAIKRAGRELGLPIEDARKALEWQVVGPVPEWNDHAPTTHAEVVAAFDEVIVTLCGNAG